jgi:hypothetical protein
MPQNLTILNDKLQGSTEKKSANLPKSCMTVTTVYPNYAAVFGLFSRMFDKVDGAHKVSQTPLKNVQWKTEGPPQIKEQFIRRAR